MEHTDIIMIIATLLGMLGGIWKISRDFRKDLQEALAEIRKEFKSTITLIFTRFDDHKESVDKKLFMLQSSTEEKYMRIDLCNKTSGNIEGRLKSIDIKLDTLLRERRNENIN